MRTTLFLLLCWGLGLGQLAAQVPPAGPWRVVHRLMPDNDGWGESAPTGKAAPLRMRRVVEKASWDVNPDSIRLLLACENPLTAPPAKAGIRFIATGATLRLDARQHLLWLAPSDSVVVLRAYRGQRLVFRHEFRAVAPPVPTIAAFVSGPNDYYCKPGNRDTSAVIITLKAIPNPDFATFMPADARYRVARFIVTPVRQGKNGEPLVFDGPQGDLSHLKLKNGDRLLIDVQLAQRQNFQMEVVDVPLTKHFKLSGPW